MQTPPQADGSFAWPARKRWLVAAVAIAAQAGLILWFSPRTPRAPRFAEPGLALQLCPSVPHEILALTDPTLFARPHPDGFSGPAWLQPPPDPELPGTSESTVAPVYLPPAPGDMGTAFHDFVKAYPDVPYMPRIWHPTPVTHPSQLPVFAAAPGSTVELEGALAVRGLVSIPPLPAWPGTDILAPSEVQVMVDARGKPVSALLLKGSGLVAADQAAVNLSLAAMFGSDNAMLNAHALNPAAGLIIGRLLFCWQTLPLEGVTNGTTNPR